LDPNDIDLLKNLRHFYSNFRFQYEKAIEFSKQLMKLNTGIEEKILYCEDLIKVKKYDEAKKIAEEVLEETKNNRRQSITRLFLIIIYLFKKDFSEANRNIISFFKFYEELDEDFVVDKNYWNFNGLINLANSEIVPNSSIKNIIIDLISLIQGESEEKTGIEKLTKSMEILESEITQKRFVNKRIMLGILSISGLIIATLGIYIILSPISYSECGIVTGAYSELLLNGDSQDIEFNPNSQMVYVAHDVNNSISVIDCNNYKVVHKIPINNPTDIDINPETNKIYVTSIYPFNFYIFDGKTNKMIHSFKLNTYSDVAVNSKTNKVFFLDSMSIKVIDESINSNAKYNDITEIPLESKPLNIDINPTTNKVYVTTDNGMLYIIDGENYTTNSLQIDKDDITDFINNYLFFDHYALKVNPIKNKIYISNINESSVLVIDGEKNQIVKNITVGSSPTDLDIDFEENLVYVANYNSKTISIINGTTDDLIKSIKVEVLPRSIMIDQSKDIIYIDGHFSPIKSHKNTLLLPNQIYKSKISFINLKQIKDSGIIQVGNAPYAISYNNITGKIYVTNTFSNNVSVIDALTQKVEDTIAVQTTPAGIDVNPKTNKIYVANVYSNTVSVIDGKTNTVEKNITVGLYPYIVDVNPNTNKIYVTNTLSNTVSVIDGKTNTVEKNITVGLQPSDIAVNPNTNKVYVSNAGNATISIIDGNTFHTTTKKIGSPLTNKLMDIDINYRNDKLYIVDAYTNKLIEIDASKIDASTNPIKPDNEIPLLISGSWVLVDQNNSQVYVNGQNDTSLAVVNVDGTISPSYITMDLIVPNGMAINSEKKMLYVTDSNYVRVLPIDYEEESNQRK
jgi:YVTN family beta-propeller protein